MRPEVEWFANIRSRSTRRAYENAIGDIMRFTGISRPEDTGGGDVGIAEPFLDLGDVGLVVEGMVAAVARSAWAPIWKPSAAEYRRTSLSTPSGVSALSDFRIVTRAHVIAWRDDLALREDIQSGATVRHRLAALSSLFEYLCENNAVTHNPVKGVKRPRAESGEGKTRRSATTRPAICSWLPARTPPPARKR